MVQVGLLDVLQRSRHCFLVSCAKLIPGVHTSSEQDTTTINLISASAVRRLNIVLAPTRKSHSN